MSVQLIGAGLGRTGSTSLWKAMRELLDVPCYNMNEFIRNPEHAEAWRAAAEGRKVDWHLLFRGYGAVVDWPAASFWHEISQAFPDAVIVLTVRDAESWWESANTTIFRAMREASANPVLNTVSRVFAARFTSRISDRAASIAAFEDHYADVRARAASDRLLEWHPKDGWEPLCAKLEMPAPTSDFPHVNTREEFVERLR